MDPQNSPSRITLDPVVRLKKECIFIIISEIVVLGEGRGQLVPRVSIGTGFSLQLRTVQVS